MSWSLLLPLPPGLREPDFVADAGTVVLGVTALTGLVVWLIYSFGGTWFQSREGRFLWIQSGVLAWTFSYNYAATSGWLGSLETPLRAWARLIIYLAGLLLIVYFGTLFLMAQREQWLESRRLPAPWWVRRRDRRRMRKELDDASS